jgi:hypothetical protein
MVWQEAVKRETRRREVRRCGFMLTRRRGGAAYAGAALEDPERVLLFQESDD